MIAVIDTSVVVKWYAAEEDSLIARRLVGADLVAPDLILVELGHALWKKHRLEQLVAEQAHAGLRHLQETVALLPSASLVTVALQRAFELDHAVYDCVFLVLAERLQLPLITSDEKLVARCREQRHEGLVMSLREWFRND